MPRPALGLPATRLPRRTAPAAARRRRGSRLLRPVSRARGASRACATDPGRFATTRRARPRATSRPTLSSVSTRSPASVTSRRSSSGSASRNGPGALGSGRSDSPSSRAERPAAVIQSLASEDAQTASTTRPPGRRTRTISESARDGSGTSITPKRQITPSTDASGRSIDEASSTRNSTFSTPSSAARRRAAATISGATSVESSSPSGPSRSAAMKPVSPGPGGELEHGVARTWVEQSHEALVEVARHLAAEGRLALPARGGSPPGLDLLVLGGRYVATCANCGMMSRPYASSTSSWPSVMR